MNLAQEFFATASRHGDRLALSVDGVDYSYAQLAGIVREIAARLKSHHVGGGSRVGILASRSLPAFAGILATCSVGATYVPINVGLPAEALIKLFHTVKPGALVIDERGESALEGMALDSFPVLRPADPSFAELQEGSADQRRESNLGEGLPSVPPDALAYIEFTSGSTGVPKGVMVPVGAVTHFLQMMQERYGINADDRIAATSDITFDISFFNMFMAWKAGASLHVVPATQLMAPAKFIQEKQLTVWFSVPSIATFMRRMKLLAPGAFPSLRYSLFAGEPLPLNSALAWQAAAPGSTVENLYGPTEATVVCTGERIGEHPNVTPDRGIIAMGHPLPGSEVAVLDSELNFLPPNQPGQLALSGAQLAQGYFEQPELTAQQFRMISGRRWYLTGDLGFEDATGAFHHLGRIDNQVKVLGNRVELEEVESHLREVCQTDMVGALAWPIAHGSAQGLVAFVSGTERTPSEVKQQMEKRVVGYMVPKAVHILPSLPLNANGKVDRQALLRLLTDDSA